MGALPKHRIDRPQEVAKKAARAKLRLVPGGPATVARKAPVPKAPVTTAPRVENRPEMEVNLRIVLVFFLGFVAALAALLVFMATPGEHLPKELQSFDRLHEIYRAHGIEAFLAEKKSLHDRVQKILTEKPSAAEVRAARNLAALLFPELLPDEDFEKADAMAGWSRLEHAIEQSPRTTESRLWFEEFRATLWNYENADRTTPRLTPWGRQVLRIYDVMTAP